MKAAARRLGKVEASLTPKQQVLLWLDQMFGYGSEETYAAWLVEQPADCRPRVKIAEAVRGAVGAAMRGESRETIRRAVQHAVRDVYFLTALVIDLIAWVDERVGLFEVHAALCARTLQLAMIRGLALKLPGAPTKPSDLRTATLNLRDHLVDLVGAVCEIQQTVRITSERYFDGHPIVFPGKARSLAETAERAETLVAEYNRFVASEAKRLGTDGPSEAARAGAGLAHGKRLALDLAAIRKDAATGAIAATQHHVRLAQADALWNIGRTEEAARLLRACSPQAACP